MASLLDIPLPSDLTVVVLIMTIIVGVMTICGYILWSDLSRQNSQGVDGHRDLPDTHRCQ